MGKKILFCLHQCIKCSQTKELFANRPDVEIFTFPHDLSKWNESEVQVAKKFDVFEDLRITAPILWVDGQKHLGYLRIRKWLQDNS